MQMLAVLCVIMLLIHGVLDAFGVHWTLGLLFVFVIAAGAVEFVRTPDRPPE